MANKADIQYIRHSYTDGTAARKIYFNTAPKKAPLPLFEPEMMEPDRKIRVAVDPLCSAAIVIAAVLLVVMVVNLLHFGAVHQEQVALQEYVYMLSNENAQLQQTYQAGYDLAEIEAQALALGMVPAEQLQTVTINGRIPAQAAEPTFWEGVQQFFGELFANACI